MQQNYDVVVMGGGLAGLTLAIQLKKNTPSINILVVDRLKHPLPEAAHKVGESSVEIASQYFDEYLKINPLLKKELPKLGLRYFFPQEENRDIAQRVELGPSDFLFVRSYQIDRGHFENALIKTCIDQGIEVVDNTKVLDFELGHKDHKVLITENATEQKVHCKYLVDASSRVSLLKKKLKLQKKVSHNINSSWFRVKSEININDWSKDSDWKNRIKHSRRLSTNHLMGNGYWVWIIPLATGSTSIGIVAQDDIHAFSEYNTFEKALVWLQKHEPQLAGIVKENLDDFQDFLGLKHFSHSCKQIFSDDGWFITGEAGMFLDPFYSPGSDFIAMNNTFINEIITKDFAGNNTSMEVREFERTFRTLFLAFRPIYEQAYPIMGNAKVMSIKVMWDFVMYWSGVALLFCRKKMTDLVFMKSANEHLGQFYLLNVNMQDLFLNWSQSDANSKNKSGLFLDYSKIPFLRDLNEQLLVEVSDGELLEKLAKNVSFAKELASEITKKAIKSDASLMPLSIEVYDDDTRHLQHLWEVFEG